VYGHSTKKLYCFATFKDDDSRFNIMSDVDAIYYQNPFDLFDSYSTYFFHDFVWGQSFSHFTDKKGILEIAGKYAFNMTDEHDLWTKLDTFKTYVSNFLSVHPMYLRGYDEEGYIRHRKDFSESSLVLYDKHKTQDFFDLFMKVISLPGEEDQHYFRGKIQGRGDKEFYSGLCSMALGAHGCVWSPYEPSKFGVLEENATRVCTHNSQNGHLQIVPGWNAEGVRDEQYPLWSHLQGNLVEAFFELKWKKEDLRNILGTNPPTLFKDATFPEWSKERCKPGPFELLSDLAWEPIDHIMKILERPPLSEDLFNPKKVRRRWLRLLRRQGLRKKQRLHRYV